MVPKLQSNVLVHKLLIHFKVFTVKQLFHALLNVSTKLVSRFESKLKS